MKPAEVLWRPGPMSCCTAAPGEDKYLPDDPGNELEEHAGLTRLQRERVVRPLLKGTPVSRCEDASVERLLLVGEGEVESRSRRRGGRKERKQRRLREPPGRTSLRSVSAHTLPKNDFQDLQDWYITGYIILTALSHRS